jgi:putative NADPH-quinone reductase
VGQQINKLMKDMSSVTQAIQDADLIVFSYPVYTFIAPYQMHKFIELLKQQDIDLTSKFATQIST